MIVMRITKTSNIVPMFRMDLIVKKQATEEGGNIKGKQVTSTSIKSDSAALDVQDAENILLALYTL